MNLDVTKEERVLRVINRKEVDYLPSQISFADRANMLRIAKSFGFINSEEFDDYLENHLYLTSILQDKPMDYRDDIEEMNRLSDLDFCIPDWKNKVIYDNWGMGIKVGANSFFVSYHPLQGKTSRKTANLINRYVSDKVLFAKDLETAVREYEVPEISKSSNFSDWDNDLGNYSGKYLVWPSGYFGIFERSYSLMGWEEFMVNIVLKPKVVEELLEKVTSYKIEFAKKLVERGFRIAHHGDDLGTQENTFFSLQTFRKHILPYIKREWEIYTNAGIPIQLHSCGKIDKFLPDLIDIGLKILEPVQPCMNLNYLKKEYGKDLIFFGGINTQKLPFITPQQVKELTKDVIWTLGKGGGLIIAPSQGIMNDIPIENIKALVDTIKEERVKVVS